MASIGKYTDKSGRTLHRILFVHPIDCKRKTIWLGKITKRDLDAVKSRVESLVTAMIHGNTPDDDTSRWVAKLSRPMVKKLSGVGLIASREPVKASPEALLGGFLAAYIAKREADTKPATRTVYKRTQKHLVAFFGASTPLVDITAGHAADFRRYLITLKRSPKGKKGETKLDSPEQESKLADNTIRRTCGFARQFFSDAVERKLISENPFSSKSISVGIRRNTDRFYFVTAEEAAKVLDACPDAQSRLVFALARFGGLRTPSETLALKWVDVDWVSKRMTVHAPKTEHHEGKGSRIVPIFPELLPYLQEAFDPDSEKAVTIAQDASVNLRTKFTRIIEKAGLKPWPKLFQNLRSTRQTELEDQFPSHVVCSWLGNSEQVAKKHYLQATDEHFERAAQDATSMKTAHKTAQQASVDHGEAQNEIRTINEKAPVSLATPTKQGLSKTRAVDDTRLEPNWDVKAKTVSYESDSTRDSTVLAELLAKLSPGDRQALVDHAEQLASLRPVDPAGGS